KPILNRALTYESSIPFALKTGFLSFDSTRVSANDVGYPIDVVIYRAGQSKLIERRFHEEQTGHIGEMWGEKLKRLIHEVPDVWDQVLMDEDKPSLLQQSQQQQQ
ncbi:MAG: peptidase, partial [Bacteroidota bacterium]